MFKGCHLMGPRLSVGNGWNKNNNVSDVRCFQIYCKKSTFACLSDLHYSFIFTNSNFYKPKQKKQNTTKSTHTNKTTMIFRGET